MARSSSSDFCSVQSHPTAPVASTLSVSMAADGHANELREAGTRGDDLRIRRRELAARQLRPRMSPGRRWTGRWRRPRRGASPGRRPAGSVPRDGSTRRRWSRPAPPKARRSERRSRCPRRRRAPAAPPPVPEPAAAAMRAPRLPPSSMRKTSAEGDGPGRLERTGIVGPLHARRPRRWAGACRRVTSAACCGAPGATLRPRGRAGSTRR